MSRCGLLILDVNPKEYKVAEHIATEFEENPQIISTLKNAKPILSMKPGKNLKKSVVGPRIILASLVKIKIGQGSSKSGRFFGIPSISPIIDNIFILEIKTRPKHWWINSEGFFLIGQRKLGQTYSCCFEGRLWKFIF